MRKGALLVGYARVSTRSRSAGVGTFVEMSETAGSRSMVPIPVGPPIIKKCGQQEILQGSRSTRRKLTSLKHTFYERHHVATAICRLGLIANHPPAFSDKRSDF